MAISLNNKSAATLEDYRVFTDTLPGSVTPEWSDSNTLRLNKAMDAIEGFCRRAFIPETEADTTATEIFDGGGYNYKYDLWHNVYIAQQAPIKGDVVVYKYDDTADKWVEIDEAVSYEESGKILFPRASGNFFEKGFQNYKVSYAYGYTQDTVPQAIKDAQSQLAQFYDQIEGPTEAETYEQDGVSISYTAEIPHHIKKLIGRYIR